MNTGLHVILTVDWEGLSLRSENLSRIQRFKETWGFPIVHYMNPAYFTHPELKNKENSSSALNLIKRDDETGLHLHGPRHFIVAAGVAFKAQPSFAVAGDSYTGADMGQEVMLHAYSQSEFAQILAFSFSLFRHKGFKLPESFRAGGWMLDQDKLAVLAEFGIKFDSSAAPADTLDGSCWQGESLQRYLSILWGDIHKNSQPYWCSEKKILEVPNNLGAIDYWQAGEAKLKAEQSLALAQNKKHLVVVTAHQETALQYFDILDEFLQRLTAEGRSEVRFITHAALVS